MREEEIRHNSEVVEQLVEQDAPLYNSKILRSYINYLRHFHPYVDVNEILKFSGIELYQIEDDDYWFTQEQVNKFYSIVLNLTNEKNIAYNAGRYGISPDTLGYFRNYVVGLIGPRKVYEKISELASKLVRSSEYRCIVRGKNQLEIIVTPKPGVVEQPFQCENRLGYFEAIPLLFNYPPPEIEHPECMFKGGKRCRYVIRLHEKLSNRLKKLFRTAMIAVLCGNLVGILFVSNFAWMVSAVLSLFGLLVVNSYIAHVEKMELLTSLSNLQISADALFSRLSENYNDITLTIEVAHVLSTKRNLKELLEEIVNLLRKRLDYDRGMILLADRENQRLHFAAGYGYTEEQKKWLETASFNLANPASKGVFVRSFWDKRPYLISDIDLIKEDLSPHSVEFAKAVGAKSFICCPITYQERAIGVLAVDNIYSKRPLVQRDLDLLTSIARELGIWIENARLNEDREKQFINLIQVLASSIDARDPTTRGHSERVAEYAVGIAKELGLSGRECEVIRIAGLLHDYGKIAIEDNVLKKEGPLSQEEFEYVKLHAEKTMEILKMVGFDSDYDDIPTIAGLHHERWDGSGYPLGLQGEQIPLGARILAVADVFDALTSPRPYRRPFAPEEAIKVLNREKGVKFDPKVVDAFIRYYGTKRNA